MAITVFSFSIPLVLRIRSASSKQEAMLVAGLLASLAGSAAHAFFDFNLSIFAIVHVLIMLSGVVAARLYDAGDLKGIPLGRGPARGLALVVGAILAAIATWTGRATASYLLADASESVQTDLQRLETAQALGAYAIQADPRYWRAHEAYAAALQARARWYFDPAGKRELARQAIASYEEVLRLNPYGNHTRLLLSRVYRDLLKQPERGVQILRELVADAPKVSVYHAELGAHLWQMGQEEEALAAFQDALRMDPRDSDVRLQRKRLRESMGKNASSK
jgi:tetratricopeptide (TPR) repeat protein